MEIERISYLSNFEELVNEHGVGIQHVSGGPAEPPFSYTVGLFEADHPEFITFGLPPQLAQTILNQLSRCVLKLGMRFGPDQRLHHLFQAALAYLTVAHDPHVDWFCTAYPIRDRRYPDDARYALDGLQLHYQDPSGRWPWHVDSDYVDWPYLGPPPKMDAAIEVLIPDE